MHLAKLQLWQKRGLLMEASLVLFASAMQALDAEDWVNANKYPARLIPIPSSVKAGCGQALLLQENPPRWWKKKMAEDGIRYEAMWQGELK